MADETTTITAHCLCKAHTFTATVPKSALPLQASCCHCTSCRRVTGALYSSAAAWPDPSVDLSQLKRFSFSENIELFSCQTCSSGLFCMGNATGNKPWVVTGALVNGPGVARYATHMFVGDTLDGGASIWLPREDEDGKPVKRYKQSRRGDDVEEVPADWPGPKKLSQEQLDAKPSPEVTNLSCFCKGVQLQLRSGADLRSTPEEDLRRWFVDPQTLKYTGSLECCDSCRLSFGSDLIAWAFAPLSHLAFPGDSGRSEFPQTIGALREGVVSSDKDPRLGTLAYYKSSPEIERYFCSRCSASVFYALHDRPDMLDIAVGLLDHPDGARAEGLLKWLDKIGWAQDAAGGWREGLGQTAGDLQQEWAGATGKPLNTSPN
ncbi:duf636 domain protein [Colletotrichum musicola]|uniref:Duf636 domain protein n=1 Tax=Colletotrichum musicola TaxID=2175873 RepID=A0A8H6K110_9PEZI|nr:duf636 domain protein [Colletotrichum musicola]